MSLGFFSAFLQAGGKEAAKGLRDAMMEAAPNTSIAAGQVVQESKLDDAGEVIQRTRRQVTEAQAHFDAVNSRYQQLLGAAETIEQKIAGFQAIIDDPAKSDGEKAQAQTQLAAHNKSLSGLVEKIEKVVPDLEHYRTELHESQEFLHQAEEAYKNKATKLVKSTEDAKSVRRELDQAKLSAENAKQREADARVVAGLATEGDDENPAIAAMRRAAQKAKDEAANHNMKAETLTKVATHSEDDPIVQAAMAEASGTASHASVSDRLAALKQRAA